MKMSKTLLCNDINKISVFLAENRLKTIITMNENTYDFYKHVCKDRGIVIYHAHTFVEAVNFISDAEEVVCLFDSLHDHQLANEKNQVDILEAKIKILERQVYDKNQLLKSKNQIIKTKNNHISHKNKQIIELRTIVKDYSNRKIIRLIRKIKGIK